MGRIDKVRIAISNQTDGCDTYFEAGRERNIAFGAALSSKDSDRRMPPSVNRAGHRRGNCPTGGWRGPRSLPSPDVPLASSFPRPRCVPRERGNRS